MKQKWEADNYIMRSSYKVSKELIFSTLFWRRCANLVQHLTFTLLWCRVKFSYLSAGIKCIVCDYRYKESQLIIQYNLFCRMMSVPTSNYVKSDRVFPCPMTECSGFLITWKPVDVTSGFKAFVKCTHETFPELPCRTPFMVSMYTNNCLLCSTVIPKVIWWND